MPRTRLAVRLATAATTAAAAGMLVAIAPTTATAVAVTDPSNLLLPASATFDVGIGFWASMTGTSLSTVSSPTRRGAGALALTNTTSNTIALVAESGSDTVTRTPAVAGQRYGGWAFVRGPSRAAQLRISFFDSGGQRIATALGQAITDRSDAWMAPPAAVGIAPDNTASVAVAVVVNGVAPGERHLVDDVAIVTASGGSKDVVGPLHTQGNRIVQANGQPVILRGMNLEGLESSAPTAPHVGPNERNVSWAKAWGANYLRVPLGEQYWLSSSCKYMPNYANLVDAAVQSITSRHMVALLDLHRTTLTPCGTPGNQRMADDPGAITFWQQVAGRYKTNPLVAFDLYNEPHEISDDIWRWGGKVQLSLGRSFQAAGMQQMYYAVRGTGATNLVMVAGNTFAGFPPTTAPLDGTNIVYEDHAYTCPKDPPPNCAEPKPYQPQIDRWAPLGANYPILVGEFGWPNGNDGYYLRNTINAIESYGWSWSAWNLMDGTWGTFSLLSSGDDPEPYEPNPAGMYVLAALRGADGNSPLTYTPPPADGSTEPTPTATPTASPTATPTPSPTSGGGAGNSPTPQPAPQPTPTRNCSLLHRCAGVSHWG